MASYPALSNCGGYTLLQLGSGSKNFVEIEGPDTGIAVPYLKDILNQEKLYIRPLQCDISEEDVDGCMNISVSLRIAIVIYMYQFSKASQTLWKHIYLVTTSEAYC